MEDRVLIKIKHIFSMLLIIILVGACMMIPALGLLWFSGIKYASFGALIFYIIKVLVISFPIEALEKLVIHTFASTLSLSTKVITIFDHILDFSTSLWIIHFVDEWSPNVTISTTGEITFTSLLILLTIILDKNAQTNR